MKRILISLITAFVLFTYNANASVKNYEYVPLPDSNAVWSEIYWKSISDETNPSWVYNKYAIFNEDTIINGANYHKLYHTNKSVITKENSKVIGGIREDSLRRVFINKFEKTEFEIYHSNEKGEIMIIDFSKNVGDTLWSEKDHMVIPPRSFIVINKIDTVEINSSYRRVYSFEGIPWYHWIEGIGRDKGLLFIWSDLPTNGINNDLICMHKNDTLQYYYPEPNNLYDDCVPSAVLSGTSHNPAPEIQVYPNPAINGQVNFENLDFDILELFSPEGIMINSYNIHGRTSFSLDITQLLRGIYIYQLKSKGSIPSCGKIIVN